MKRQKWTPSEANIQAALTEILEAGIVKGTDDLKLGMLLDKRAKWSPKWRAARLRLSVEGFANRRARILRRPAPTESGILWLIPDCEHVPTKLRFDKRTVPIRDVTLAELRIFTDRVASRSSRNEAQLAELRRLVKNLSAKAHGDETVTVGALHPLPEPAVAKKA